MPDISTRKNKPTAHQLTLTPYHDETFDQYLQHMLRLAEALEFLNRFIDESIKRKLEKRGCRL